MEIISLVLSAVAIVVSAFSIYLQQRRKLLIGLDYSTLGPERRKQRTLRVSNPRRDNSISEFGIIQTTLRYEDRNKQTLVRKELPDALKQSLETGTTLFLDLDPNLYEPYEHGGTTYAIVWS